MNDWSGLETELSRLAGIPFAIREVAPLGGGCISRAYRVVADGCRYFAKVNDAHSLAMFEAEARALTELGRAPRIRVPGVVWCGLCDGRAVLVLEYLDLKPLDPVAASRLGEGLAEMHQLTRETFGWDIDNFIGATPQDNCPDEEWIAFFRERRLRPQFELAAANGYQGELGERGERLMEALDVILEGHSPGASLLHGDLWGGNAAADCDGAPVLFDPAAYHGDRETDIAMTELFGGFGSAFREAYESVWPLDPGYSTRRVLYNLYHVLNHLNLFGGAYLHQARRDIDRLLAETRP